MRAARVPRVCRWCCYVFPGKASDNFCSDICKEKYKEVHGRAYKQKIVKAEVDAAKKCRRCGAEFVAAGRYQIYCSADCRKAQESETGRIERALNKKYTKKTCPICSNEFQPTRRKQMYCGMACSVKARKPRYSAEVRICQHCGSKFNFIASPNSKSQGRFCNLACFRAWQKQQKAEGKVAR